jgi:hypothetical protein
MKTGLSAAGRADNTGYTKSWRSRSGRAPSRGATHRFRFAGSTLPQEPPASSATPRSSYQLASVILRAATPASCLLWLKSFEHGRSNRQRRGGMAAGSFLVQSSQLCSSDGSSRVHDRSGSRCGSEPFNDRPKHPLLADAVREDQEPHSPPVRLRGTAVRG